MRILALIAACCTVSATQATAQDISFDIFHTADCVARAEDYADRQLCIGQSAARCMEDTSFGYSTLGMSACTDAELTWWDARLNHFYKKARTLEKAEDAEAGSLPGYVSQADALRDMQRAWITFRDSKCGYERSQWGGGTGGGPAMVSCLMYETAEQAMYLEVQAVGF